MSDRIYERLQTLIEKESHKSLTHSVVLGVQSADGRVDFQGAAGAASADSPYFIASISKMYTVAVVMQLVDEGLLDLDAPIANYLAHDLFDGIHVYQGVDYSQHLKVYHLIHQSSGIADYFEDSLKDDLIQNKDRAYTVTDVVEIVRRMTPKFAPESGQKSHYSDTNYQLLGVIIESITGQSVAATFKSRIFDRLGLAHTYLFDSASASFDDILPIYHKDQRPILPLMLSSERGAGGIVSTLAESLCFLRGYFSGELFDPAHFERMYRWNSLFFPLQYGYGLMRFKLPRWMTLFRETPELIGHSGSTGSFAFYAPKENLFIAGTFNQIDRPSRPFNFMLKVVDIATKD